MTNFKNIPANCKEVVKKTMTLDLRIVSKLLQEKGSIGIADDEDVRFLRSNLNPSTHTKHITNEYAVMLKVVPMGGCCQCPNTPKFYMPITVIPVTFTPDPVDPAEKYSP